MDVYGIRHGVAAVILANAKNKDDRWPTYLDSYVYGVRDHDSIYGTICKLLGDTVNEDEAHELSADAASWCEIASVNETYEVLDGFLKVVVVDLDA